VSVPLPSAATVRALLERFPEVRGPVRLDRPRRDELLTALASGGFVLPISWTPWGGGEGLALCAPERLGQADAGTVCALITAIVRLDRFAAGEVDIALGSGRMGALLQRLAELEAQGALGERWSP
jgi:hypothetical protein